MGQPHRGKKTIKVMRQALTHPCHGAPLDKRDQERTGRGFKTKNHKTLFTKSVRNGGKGWVGKTDVLKIQACLNFFGRFDKVHRVPYDHKSTKSDTFINPHDRPFNHS